MRKLIAISVILACSYTAFAGGAFFSDQDLKIAVPFDKSYDYNSMLVTKVIDGDTLRLENGESVRLIGVDTPESKVNAKLKRDSKRTNKDYETIITMGKAAAEFTKKLADARRVKLEFDVEKRDRYNRLLAYVYLPDGKMLNAEIVKAGYAQVMTIPPNVMHQDMFLQLQEEARESKRGLWTE
ncbi:MAG: thermonuclease family protein [Candidatus Omnitrophica bacterium]|nr:thermonuclease family protein [Candidatus Omnitrophota bacterium]